MYGAQTAIDFQRPPEGNNVYERLNWLLAVNALAERRRQLFKTDADEEEMLLMRRPVDARRAYALFGMMLGMLPPAAIFIKMFGYGIKVESGLLFLGCLLMNVICALVGYRTGRALGQLLAEWERKTWMKMLVLVPLLGTCWGMITGAAGGFVFFGIGAIFGAYLAMAVGAVAFTFFATLHRLVWRGGMIDARHFWPLASGVVMTISALILGL